MESKETLEQETIEEYYLYSIKNVLQFNNDAKAIRLMEKYFEQKCWIERRSYSEENMQDFAKFCLLCKDEELPYIFPKDWLKHIKKQIK